MSNINYRRLFLNEQKNEHLAVTEKELEFLKHACSDLTYKQIAILMYLSES